jgi:hypothetical protein
LYGSPIHHASVLHAASRPRRPCAAWSCLQAVYRGGLCLIPVIFVLLFLHLPQCPLPCRIQHSFHTFRNPPYLFCRFARICAALRCITQASCMQRAGRAGRVRPGHAFRLCTKEPCASSPLYVSLLFLHLQSSFHKSATFPALPPPLLILALSSALLTWYMDRVSMHHAGVLHAACWSRRPCAARPRLQAVY